MGFAQKGEADLSVFQQVQMADSKTELRKMARARRKGLAFAGFAAALARHAGVLADALAVRPGMVVGGYMALPEEADPALALAALAARGCIIAYPRVTGPGLPLTFHTVGGGEEMVRGAFGILEPPPHGPSVTPDLVLVPLLAFDGAGHRLGHGGGFYDRTLCARAALGPFLAVGIAYAGQQVDFLPHGAHDWPLDAVLTEQGLKVFP